MALIRRRDVDEGGLARREWDPFQMMRELMKWDPFQELGRAGAGYGGMTFIPAFEVKETKDSYVFKADLPGVKEEDIDLSVTGNRLTVSGQRSEEKREEDERFYAYERSYGTFSRSFTLPQGTDPENVHAELKNGVLSVVVPKRPEVQPKRIQLGSPKAEKEKMKA